MAKVLISEKYLHDIANAIRVKLDSQSTYTPAQMAAAIADITGTISGTITPSTDTDKVLVTDSNLTAIANAIRAKLDVETLYTPAQMAAAILSIESSTPVPTIVSWSSGTDSEVAAMIDAAHTGAIDLQEDAGWAVGDVRTISIGAFTDGVSVSHTAQDVDIVITSFDEYMESGNLFQFDFKDALTTGTKMNTNSSNMGGYSESTMQKTTLPALVSAMPEWIRTRLIDFSVLASAGGESKTIQTIVGNKLSLRSIVEVFGYAGTTVTGEGTQVPYYASTNNRRKKRGHSGSNSGWWSRSSASNNSSSWGMINANGIDDYYGATSNQGLSPFGCL